MNGQYVDLHVHTTVSDGSFSPEEAVLYAASAGLSAIGITDHDTVDGIPAAAAEARRQGIELVPGIELSAELNAVRRSEMHILGYFIDWEDRSFRETLDRLIDARRTRAVRILEKLDNLKVRLDRDRLYEIAGTGVIGRLHFARAMIEQGVVGSVNDAFHRYLGAGRPAFVPKHRLRPEEAIRLIRDVGGIPVLAHPYYGHYSDRDLLLRLVREGLQGIEVWHSKHPPATVEMFQRLADELGLVATGGSDCHGGVGGESPLMGSVKVPCSVVAALKDRKKEFPAAGGTAR